MIYSQPAARSEVSVPAWGEALSAGVGGFLALLSVFLNLAKEDSRANWSFCFLRGNSNRPPRSWCDLGGSFSVSDAGVTPE